LRFANNRYNLDYFLENPIVNREAIGAQLHVFFVFVSFRIEYHGIVIMAPIPAGSRGPALEAATGSASQIDSEE
jgi:hypothetical protein